MPVDNVNELVFEWPCFDDPIDVSQIAVNPQMQMGYMLQSDTQVYHF